MAGRRWHRASKVPSENLAVASLQGTCWMAPAPQAQTRFPQPPCVCTFLAYKAEMCIRARGVAVGRNGISWAGGRKLCSAWSRCSPQPCYLLREWTGEGLASESEPWHLWRLREPWSPLLPLPIPPHVPASQDQQLEQTLPVGMFSGSWGCLAGRIQPPPPPIHITRGAEAH